MRDIQYAIKRIRAFQDCPYVETDWPMSVPAIGQVLRDGLDLGPATILVGANGSGKSTLIEGVAMAFGLNAEGGSTGAMHRTRNTESTLHEWLALERNFGAPKWGYFLRAETMHGLYSYLEDNPGRDGVDFHRMSHGESFIQILESRFNGPGLFVLDEPESALSFNGCLALISVLSDLLRDPACQVIMATHSPVVAALPGADIYELDETGISKRAWGDLALVQHHRRFLEEPEQYLRHFRD